jgi:hypothetical protein
MVLSTWLDGFLVRLSFLVLFGKPRADFWSVHSTRFFSLAQGVFELSSSLENPLDYGRLTLIVILIKMSYVGF